MATPATIKKRYGKYSLGPFNKESIVVELVTDGDQQNLVNLLMSNPEYVTVKPVNTDLGGTPDDVSATISGKQVTIHDGTVGQRYWVEVVGF